MALLAQIVLVVRPVYAVTILLAMFLIILHCTSRFWTVIDTRQLPPRVPSPYGLPFLQHTFAWASGGARLFDIVKAQTGARNPLRFTLPGQTMLLITSPPIVKAVLYNTSVFVTHKARSRFIRNVLGYSRWAVNSIENDTSGHGAIPLPGSNVPPEKRVLRAQQVSTMDVLSSKNGLVAVFGQFTRAFEQGLLAFDVRSEWVDMPDLFLFIRRLGTTAGIIALCGPELLRLNPEFLENFWMFDENVHFFHMGWPLFLKPRASRARAYCMEAISKWRKNAEEKSAGKIYGEEEMWDEFWGLKAMRLRNEMYYKFPETFSDAGKSGADLGILWAANCNLIPTIYYFIRALLRDRKLLERCLEEMIKARISRSAESDFQLSRFDPNNLMKSPLLVSVLNEVLRTEGTSFIGRTVESDHVIGGYTLKKGSMTVTSTHLEHMDPARWEVRANGHAHPVNQFWGSRFLDESGEKIDMKGLEGTFIPFGIGVNMCPGRHFASRAILCIAAMFLDSFEVEVTADAVYEERDYTTFGYAVCKPKNAVSFRIKKKMNETDG